MDKTHVTDLTDSTGPAVRRKPDEALQAFARLLARLVADRSGGVALVPNVGTDTSAAAIGKETSGVD